MEFPEIGHVGYMVDSADACAEQLSKVWGIDNFVVYDFVPGRCWAYGEEIFDCKLRIALGTPAVGAKVELVEYVSGTNLVMGNFLREKGQNIHHVAYYVEDYDAYKAYALEQGATIIFEMEIEDEVLGKRASCYCEYPGVPGVIEYAKKPPKMK